MTHEILRISEWRAATPAEAGAFIDKAKQTASRAVGSKWVNDGSLSPLSLYCYLKSRFGSPNGALMITRAPSIDNLIHWHYSLIAGSAAIDILGLSFRTEFMVKSRYPVVDSTWDELSDALKRDFSAHGPEMSTVRGELEEWHLLANPHARLTRIVRNFLAKLNGLGVEQIQIPVMPKSNSEDDYRAHFAEQSKCIEVYREAIAYSSAIQVLCPVWVESFINLTLLALTRPEFRGDRRLFTNLIRAPIDVRVKTLHINCLGFMKPIDPERTEFKKFHSLMNRRNDSLHGNVDPESPPMGKVYFDMYNILLFEKETTVMDIVLRDALAAVDPLQSSADVLVVEGFQMFILEHLDPDTRAGFGIAIEQDQVGWRPKTQTFGTVLPHEFPQMFLVKSQSTGPAPE